MRDLLLVLYTFSGIVLVALVLLQHGRGADMGAAFGSGASQTLFGARGSATFLSRLTAGVATAFFAISLVLTVLYAREHKNASITQTAPATTAPAGGAFAPMAPQPPATPTGVAPAVPPAVPEVPK